MLPTNRRRIHYFVDIEDKKFLTWEDVEFYLLVRRKHSKYEKSRASSVVQYPSSM